MHPAWKVREAEWAPLAPGVRFLLRPVTGDIQSEVIARVADLVGGLHAGRRDLSDLGYEDADLGMLADLNVLAGVSVFAGAVFTAERILEDWEGIVDADTAQPVEITPESIRAAMRYGAPDGGPALLRPFMAWVDRPHQPIAADQRRLRILAKWDHSALGSEHCKGCDLAKADCARGGDDGGALCPRVENAPRTEPGIAALAATRHAGVWRRAGMGGSLVGLDYAACLNVYAGDDEGGYVRCLAAIEAGALEAQGEKDA